MAELTNTRRKVSPLRQNFFCDGPYYFITSSSLGGLTPAEVAEKVSGCCTEELLTKAIGIPLAFEGDCAMDHAIIVVGDLSPQEEAEWVGRLSWKVNVPCGNLLVICGGGDEETVSGAVSGEGMGGFCDYFHKIELPPGQYLTEIYAYIPSTTGNFFFESFEPMGEWLEWFKNDRKGEEPPKWLRGFTKQACPGELGDELVSYIIRIAPLTKEPASMPPLDEDMGWCTFEKRRPEKCPIGIPRKDLLE